MTNPLLQTVWFLKRLFTKHVILNLLEIIQEALDDRQIAFRIFIDLEAYPEASQMTGSGPI